MENPIHINAEGEYDYSVSCDKGGIPETPWMVTIKITRRPHHEVALAERKSPSGYKSYAAGKEAGIEKAVASIRELETKD